MAAEVVVEEHACWMGLVAADVDERLQADGLCPRRRLEMTEESQRPEVVVAATLDEGLRAEGPRPHRRPEVMEESQRPEVVVAATPDEGLRAKGPRPRRRPEMTESSQRVDKPQSLPAVDLEAVQVSVAR